MPTTKADIQQARRLSFIDQHLYWMGEIRRRHIKDAFGVSDDTSQRDLRTYREGWAPDLELSKPGGIYRVDDSFETHIDPPDSEGWLAHMAGNQNVWLSHIPEISRLSDSPPVDVTPLIERRAIDATCLKGLIRAINAEKEVRLVYWSPHNEDPEDLWFYPHAFTNDSFRWACRGWRYDHERWGEIVLDRMVDVGERRPANPDQIGTDTEWKSLFSIRLGPNPKLKPEQKDGVRRQYHLEGDELVVKIRTSQIVYFLKRYQLEEPVTQKAPHQAPLIVLNREEVNASLPPRMRVPPEE